MGRKEKTSRSKRPKEEMESDNSSLGMSFSEQELKDTINRIVAEALTAELKKFTAAGDALQAEVAK